MASDYQDTAARIKGLRKHRGLTLEQLGDASGSSKSYIWELENNAPPRPSAVKLSAIAVALGTTSDYLLSGWHCAADAEAEALASRIRSMSDHDRGIVMALVNAIDPNPRKDS